MSHIVFFLCVFFLCVIATRLLVSRAQDNHRRQRTRAKLPDLPERRR